MSFSRRISVLAVVFLLPLSAISVAQEAATATDAARTGLAIGDVAPDFKLKTIGDKPVVLSERFGEKGKPVILLFSRANW